VTTSTETLRSLNAETFRAENREGDWEEFLRSTLTEDFVLRRANRRKHDENAESMITAIAGDTRTRTLLADTVRVFAGESVGVVASVVELLDPPTPEDRFFQNVKVFQRVASSDWRLAYWQVSGKPAP
jgi:hypothetical protein